MTGLPKDPMLLLSVVNTKLRDYYPTLDALCEDMDIEKKELRDYYSTLEVLCEDMGADQDELIDKLRGIGYEYDEARKQFV